MRVDDEAQVLAVYVNESTHMNQCHCQWTRHCCRVSRQHHSSRDTDSESLTSEDTAGENGRLRIANRE